MYYIIRMSFEVTATRRRPQRFETLAGQEFVVSTLTNAIAQGRVAHAYLFSGPRGVGKTTCARLLAKALNCQNGPTAEPCGECDNCKGIAQGNSLDVIEIDGASNTGVNDVRVIKEEVMFPPTSSKYKIYIIDEVHMLSQSAFNALLKTIEEPPEYVVFIFATTETQKVPATIRSRCQQFNFHLLSLDTIKKLLKEACEETGIEAEDEALFWIAKESTGSMRDAYTLFDQVVSFSDGKITLAQIREKLGLVGVEKINSIMSDVIAKKQEDALNKVQDILAKGMSIEQIIKDFTDYFRSLLLIKEGVTSENVLGEQVSDYPAFILNAYNEEQLEAALDMFLNLYRDIRYSLNPKFELELAISRLARLRYTASNSVVIEQIARLKNDLVSGTVSPVNPKLADIESVAPEAVEKPAEPIAQPATQSVEEPVVETAPISADPTTLEPAVVSEDELRAKLEDVLPSGVGGIKQTDDGIILSFGSKFYFETAQRELDLIRKNIRTALDSDVNVVVTFSESLAQRRNEELAKQAEIKKEPVVEAKPVTIREDNGSNFVDDLMSAFRGHEEQ